MIVSRLGWSLVLILGLSLCAVKVWGVKTNGNLASRAAFVKRGDSTRANGTLESVVDGLRTATITTSGDTTNTTRQRQKCFALHGSNPSLHVHLEKTVNVSFVLVYAAVDDDNESVQDLMEGLEVGVGSQPCVKDVKVGQQRKMALIQAACDTPVTGSRVTLRLPGQTRTLHLCEVEVYDTTCDCLEGCEVDQGFCFAPCVRNEKCRRENVAIFQPTDSSPLSNVSGPPKLVVNGNTGTMFISRKVTEEVNEQNCIHSRSAASYALQADNSSSLTSSSTSHARRKRVTSFGNYVNPWWAVKMEEMVPVRGVVIYRANAEQVWETETYTEVTVDGERCAKYGPEYTTRDQALRPRLVLTCDRVIRGHKVEVTRLPVSRTVLPAPFQLCEVQIWACRAGWYGDQCNIRCGRCEGGRDACDTVTGDCPDGCAAGWYDSTCKSRCRDSCLNSLCDQATGHCLQCPPNHELPFCTAITTTPTANVTPATASNNSSNTIVGDDDSETGSSGAVVAGAVVGTLVVVAVVLFFFVWYRKRRGALETKQQTAARTPSQAGPKPEATKTESFTYIEAVSPTIPSVSPTGNSDVIHHVTATHDVSTGKNTYETLDMNTPAYENVQGDEDHVYMMPVFTRGDSLSSNASGPYVNMGDTISMKQDV